MTVGDTIRRTAEREKLFENCTGAVLAVSGGSDSMTLLSWFVSNSPVPFAVGHINHCLRPEADAEQKMLETFCREKNVAFFAKKTDIRKLCPKGVSTETFAREKRYEFLDELRKKLGYSHIFTAHNKNDNVETFLLNLVRGMGTDGACGIPPLREDLVARPLIDLEKSEIVAYCRENGIPFAHDKTNDEPICKRNVLRNEIIPQLRKLNPSFDDAVARFIKTEREQNEAVEAEKKRIYETVKTENGLSLAYFEKNGDGFLGSCLRKAFEDATGGKKLSNVLTESLSDFAKHGKANSEICLSDGVTAKKGYAEIGFFTKEKPSEPYGIVLHEGENIIENIGILTLTQDPSGKIPKSLSGRLEARPSKNGDRIKIRESAGTKSVAKLYSDAKMPKELRAVNPVLVCDGEIVHVCGFGTNIRFAEKSGGLRADFTLF